jgi:two-component system copper resistance phosphate regulon response regulator CusR
MTRILIAEDEPRVSSLLEKGLRAAGYATTVCEDGMKAAAIASDDEFDLLILDLGLPGQDGFAVLRAMHARGETLPVLILTASSDVTATVADLELGADDYVAKPFAFKELLARVRACLRRGEREGDPLLFEAGDVRLDVRGRRAKMAGSDVELSAKETGLLEAFLRHPGDVLGREQLLAQVWGHGSERGSNLVDVYVACLRCKLGEERFETVGDRGYRLNAQPR